MEVVSWPSLILFRLIQIACHGDTRTIDRRPVNFRVRTETRSLPRDQLLFSFLLRRQRTAGRRRRNLRLEVVSIRIRARAFRQRRAGTAHPIRAILVHLWVLVRPFCLSFRASPEHPNKNRLTRNTQTHYGQDQR